MFPFNYIHNHLVRRGTHSSLGVGHSCTASQTVWRGLTHAILSCSMGSVSVFQSFVLLNQVQDLVMRIKKLPSKISLQPCPVSCVKMS